MDNEYLDKEEQEALAAIQARSERKKNKSVSPGTSSKKPNAFIQILNGDFLSKNFILGNLPFIFFIMFLLILSIGKGYYGKELSKELSAAQEELDELTGEYFETKARLEEGTQRAKLLDRLEYRNLKETTIPTKVIRIKKDVN